MSTLVINIEARTLAPISISAPVTQSGAGGGMPRMPLHGKPDVPYIPASTLRGRLRRAVVMPLAAAAARDGKPWKLDRFYACIVGQDTESEQKSETVDLGKVAALRKAEPLLDLFGIGLTLKGRLMMSHLLPTEPCEIITITGTRRDLDDDEGTIDLMSDEDRAAFVARGSANTERVGYEAAVKGLERKIAAARRKDNNADVAEWEAALATARQAASQAATKMGSMQVSTRRPIEHEAMPAHITLTGRIVVCNEREGDLDMLLKAFDSLSLMPLIGAHNARGCGEVSMELRVMRDQEHVATVQVGGFKPSRVDFLATKEEEIPVGSVA